MALYQIVFVGVCGKRVRITVRACVRACACVRVRARACACVLACVSVRASVRACERACACGQAWD